MVVYTMRLNPNAMDCLLHFERIAQRQTRCLIKVVQSDQQGEYLSKELQKHLSRCGIVHDLGAPYSFDQNRVAERMNRTILSPVHAMVLHEHLQNLCRRKSFVLLCM